MKAGITGHTPPGLVSRSNSKVDDDLPSWRFSDLPSLPFEEKALVSSGLPCLCKARGLAWWLRWSRIHLPCGRPGFIPWVGNNPWRRAWQPTPVFFLGQSQGQRSLAGCSPWGGKELDMTEWLSTAQGNLRAHQRCPSSPPLRFKTRTRLCGQLSIHSSSRSSGITAVYGARNTKLMK